MQISGRTKIVGVWGFPVSPSRSPQMHNAALAALGLDWAYVPFQVAPENVSQAAAAVRALTIVGINVTVPLKELVMPHLDIVSEDAKRIGAVNTIHNVDGVLHGYSTDGFGFLQALKSAGQTTEGRRAYLLGAGGTARAIAYALASQGCQITLANRTRKRAEELAACVNEFYPWSTYVADWSGTAPPFDLLINTTSLGMHPNIEALPILPPEGIPSNVFVYDVIYAPTETRLLALARNSGCNTANGLTMLAYQGAKSLSLWTGIPVEELPINVMMNAIQQ